MAKNVIIDLKIDTKDGVKSIGDVNKEMKTTLTTMREMEDASEAITEALKNTAVGTAEYKKLSQQLIKVNTELKNQELALEALDHEQVASELKSVAGGFADMAGGMALVGAGNESLEELVQTIARVEGATKIMTGGMEAFHSAMKLQNNLMLKMTSIQDKLAKASKGTGVAAKAAAIGQKILNAAMNANPIFLLVTALAAVVAGLGIFIAMSKKAATSQEVMNDAKDAAVEKAADELNALDELSVKLEDNTLTREEQIDAIKSLQEEYPGLLENTDAEKDSLLEVNEAIEDYNELVMLRAEADALAEVRAEAFKKKIQAQTDAVTGNNQSWTSWGLSLTNSTASQVLHQVEQKKAIQDSEKETKVIDELTKGIEEQIAVKEKQLGIDRKAREEKKKADDAKKQADKEAKKAEREAEARAKAARARAIKIAQEIAKAKVDAELKLQATLDELALAEENATTTSFQKEINAVSDKYFRLIELAKQNNMDTSILEMARDKQLTAIYNKRTQDAVNAAQERQKILADGVLAQMQHEKEIELIEANKITDVKEREEKIAEIKNRYKDKEIAAIKSAASEQATLLDSQMAQELSQAELTAEQKLLIEAKYQAQKEQLARDTEMKIAQFHDEVQLTANEKRVEEMAGWLEENQQYIDAVTSTISQTMDVLSDVFAAQAEAAAVKREDSYTAETEALKGQLNNREISQKEFDAKMKMLEDKKAEQEKQARLKAFKQNKTMAIINAVISTAQAVIAGFTAGASMGPAGVVMGPVMAAVAGALGAAQIAIVSSQKFKGNRGGLVPGAASKVDSVDAELAPGEAVINSESAMMFPQLLSQINQAGGGIPLAPEPVPSLTSGGGASVFDQGGNQTLKAYVVESEMTDSQNRVSRMERSAEF